MLLVNIALLSVCFDLGSAVVSKKLRDAILYVTTAIEPKHFIIVSDEITDKSLIEDLWHAHISVEMFNTQQWSSKLVNLSYQDYFEVLMLCEMNWIQKTMKQFDKLVFEGRISIKRSFFIWINRSITHNATRSESRNKENSIQIPEESINMIANTPTGMNGVYMQEMSRSQEVIIAALKSTPGTGNKLIIQHIWNGTYANPYKPFVNVFENWSEVVLRLTYIQKETVFAADTSERLSKTRGYCSEIMKVLQEKLGFKSTLVRMKSFGNKKKDGTGTGMIGALLRNEADIAPLDFNPTPFRSVVVDFSRVIGVDAESIMTSVPGPLPQPLILFQIFTPLVWACVVILMIFSGILLYLFTIFSSKIQCKLELTNLSRMVIVSYKTFVLQSNDDWPSNVSTRFFAVFLLCVAFITTAFYQGFITAILAIPVRSKPVDSLDDFLATNLKAVIRAETSLQSLIDNGLFTEIVPRMKAYDLNTIKSWDFLVNVAENNYALFDTASFILGLRRTFEEEGKYCKFYTSKQAVIAMPDNFAFRRNSPYREVIDEQLKWLRYFGLIEHFKEQHFAMPCKSQSIRNQPKPMSIYQMQSAFYILIGGYILAMITLTIELLTHRRKQ